MEEVKSTDSVFLLQHPLASPKDPPVVIPTLPRHRQQSPSAQIPPTLTSSYSLSPPGSPIFGPKSSRHHQSHRHHSPSTATISTTGAAGISSKALQSHPAQLSLARDLTTRLWQREAELHTMKELYDAKIRRLTEMLQDAGISPTEVENTLAGVTEGTDERQPLFERLSVTSHHLRGGEARAVNLELQSERGEDDSPVSDLYDEDCSSIILDEEDRERYEEEDDLGGNPSESMSSSGLLSLISSGTSQLTRPDDLSSRTSPDTTCASDADKIFCLDSEASTTPKRRLPISRTTRPFSPAPSDVSCPVNIQPKIETSLAIDPSNLNEVKAQQTHAQRKDQAQGQEHEHGDANHGSQSPIPSFIASTLGMRTLREKWALASGILPWNRSKSEQCTNNSSSIVTSPSGLFIRRDGIMNDKKPALVEASFPSPLQDDLPPLPDKREKRGREWDIWASIISPTMRRYPKGNHTQARPMSDIGFLGNHPKYAAMTMARDIPRPPITRIHEYLQRPDSYNPVPLHFRAIAMAATLVDTGAITPAKLYARRTQTMIAKWTLGLIMNSKPSKPHQSSFPVIRESQDILGHRRSGSNDSDMDHHHYHRENPAGMEMVSSNDRRSGALSPTELPRALSYKNQSSAASLASSSFPHSSSLNFYQSQHLIATQSVVELSDIGSPPLSMPPSFSYLGDAAGKPLTDRYGFLVNARPLAVQQGLMKLNEVHAYDDLDTPSLNRTTFEFLQTPTEDSERDSPPPPASQTSSFYFGHGHVAGMGGFAAGNGTISTASPPASFTTPILSTSTRPTSTLSPPTLSTATVTTLLSQIKVLHDSVQMTQKEKWDAFLRKRRRRVHLGETNGGALANMSSTNLSTPLFGNLMQSLEEQEQDDEDTMYWTSVCLIGIATIGKGSDWEEFRDLVRGGIPITYRNKIWQEVSGALDMRQPGYYKELLSRKDPEACQCWGDIELDLHRTFPTNVLFGPGGHGIEKLKNILLAYSLHNPTVGYCQGMNLLAGTLLLTNNAEEEAFWLLTSMLGRHLPEDYFTQQLLSPQADQRVLRELVQEIMPRLYAHFEEMHVDVTAVTFSWFLTLFTDCLPVETLLRVWDIFFVEGMIIVFKVALAILWMNEKEIMKCRNGAAVYCYMKQMTLSMHQPDKLIKVAFTTLKSYIQPEKIEAKRQRHQKSVRQELIQEQQLIKARTFVCASPPTDKKKTLQN